VERRANKRVGGAALLAHMPARGPTLLSVCVPL